MLISLESWKAVVDTDSDWLIGVPSVLIQSIKYELILLIIGGLFEVGFASCLRKPKKLLVWNQPIGCWVF
jgi:hypothetical protein